MGEGRCEKLSYYGSSLYLDDIAGEIARLGQGGHKAARSQVGNSKSI